MIVRTRLEESGIPFLHERDYQKNLALREEIYPGAGPHRLLCRRGWEYYDDGT